MTKCDFCSDYLEEGKPPACVAACPMRGLDFGELEDLRQKYGSVNQIVPLPSPKLTQPSLVINPHPNAVRAQKEIVRIENRKEK
jgi:anaerobic dimethyl sulfoxide reductase subunit B (iron-sulfur subunit)